MPYQYKREPLSDGEVDRLTSSCGTSDGDFLFYIFLIMKR